MRKKLTGRRLADFEATRDIWQEILDGVREIKAGGGKWTQVETTSDVIFMRFTATCKIYLTAT